MNKKLIFAFLILSGFSAMAQEKVIQLYPGVVPGSESWTWNEQVSDSNAFKTKVVYNVSHPTLTVFPADPAVAATGTAVIICPGGGFDILAIDKEGFDVATWLSKKGITAFVLKYRLEHSLTDNPVQEFMDKFNKKGFQADKQPVIPLAMADGKTAIAYVRAHAAEYGIKPTQIGIIGFSAGGTIAVQSALTPDVANRPDFVGAIYPYLSGALQPSNIPAGEPPLFIAAASDDPLNSNDHENTDLYNKWIAAKNSAEIHLYVKGGHGFGMAKQNIPTDTWIDRFGDWLNTEGFLKPLSNVKTDAQKRAEDWANFQKMIEYGLHNDWANLNRYGADDKRLEAMPPDPKRVIFIGNSITDNWGSMDTAFFKDNDYLSRGIGGQTSSQMLVRFREDIIDLKPAAVVISAGTNDIAQNTGYISLENIFGNIVSMAQLAKANGIIPILTSILPATDFSWHRGLEPAEKIIKVNQMIKDYAAKNHFVYVDYWSALVNDKNGMRPNLTLDGLVHPNMDGYHIMEPLVKKGINIALHRK